MMAVVRTKNGKATTKHKKKGMAQRRKIAITKAFRTNPFNIDQTALGRFVESVRAVGGVSVAKRLLSLHN